jgi:zinc transporter
MAPPEAGAAGSFLWLHFNLANQASVRWLRQRLALPAEFYESLEEQHNATRVEAATSAVVAVITDVTMFGLEACEVSSMRVSVDARLFVSARHTPLSSVHRLREAVRNGEAFSSPLGLLTHLLNDQAHVLLRVVRETLTQIDAIEDQLLAGRPLASRAKLGTLRRTLVRLRRLLAPEPAALFRLLSRPASWMHPGDVELLRQAAEDLAAAVADCAAAIERVRLVQEEVGAAVTEQTNRTLFLLTVVTVVSLPMTIVPGLPGMNVGGVPLQGGHGFWVVVATVAGVAGLGAYLLLRRYTRN